MSRGRDPREERVGEAVRSLRPPEEREALERALAVAADAREGPTHLSHRHTRHKLAAALLAAGAAAALVLTPAGAEVRDWVADAIDDNAPVERAALTRVPSGGEVLVSAPTGIWLVRDDGSRRLLGDFEEATFSPRGLYVAATSDRTLTALDPAGEVRWALATPGPVSDARWAPSGYRIAYRTASRRGQLNVVAGDGTGARKLAAGIAQAAPSWRPPPEGADPALEPNVLTYVRSSGSVTTLDVDSGREIWRWAAARPAKSVAWAGPDRLVVAYARSVKILDRRGSPIGSVPLPDDSHVDAVTPSPDGERLAIVLSSGVEGVDARSRLYLARIAGGDRRERTVFSGYGSFEAPAFSPNDEWILLPWTDTDQWVFINPSEDRKLLRRVIAVGNIARQFDPGGRGEARPPEVEGWCCP